MRSRAEMEDFNDGMDGKDASWMRKVHSEQFHTLVKMHLSFELDLNTEETDIAEVVEKAKLKKWGILHFSKKPKSMLNLQKGVEGAALTKEGINQVKQLVEYLSKEDCIVQEGIFRRTGKLTRQQELKNALYQGLPLDLEEGRFSVHDCASVLKGFLADLSEPLLTDLHYPAHCQIAELCTSSTNGNDSRLLRSLQLLLLLLPPPNRIVLKNILGLLNKTATHENSNKMNCDTLATLFTPHLMCPRKLSPEALHVNSQNLSGLVAFMIKKGDELFEIPPKLSTDIRAFWVETQKKLLSPQKPDLNESTSDMTGTAHTVFSFVNRDLTAKATATQDTQAALAQLYAHIQSMPESAKKRRLVKQFNKENGQGTPRHVKHNVSAKSFGDSIKKRIFQKKLLNHKKIIDVKLGCNFSRSSSEENMLSNTLEGSVLLPKVFSKSKDEISDMDNYETLGSENYEALSQDNLLKVKHMSNSTGSLNTPSLTNYKKKSKIVVKSLFNLSERSFMSSNSNSPSSENKASKKKYKKGLNSKLSLRYSRHHSEPPDMYSSQPCYVNCAEDKELIRQTSESTIPLTSRSSIELIAEDCKNQQETKEPQKDEEKGTEPQEKSDPAVSEYLNRKTSGESTAFLLSPATKNKLKTLYAAHTSTPSNLLRKSLAVNDYILTPMTDDDKSMSPITQSATKMTKAMQETMMTPRSRKPVMMVSASNLCGLATLNNGSMQYDSTNSLQTPSFNLINRKNYASIIEESPNLSLNCITRNTIEDKENFKKVQDIPEEQSYVTCLDDGSTIQKSTTMSFTNKEYFLSRSVLTASPVDLSFTSRTGDFEQSESDLNVLVEEGNNPGSDTSGIASGSPNSANNSTEKVEETISSPRKRCTSLQRNDSKRSFKDESIVEQFKTNKILKQKQLSESTLNSVKIKDSLPETSF
ncbi:uncharacterized protein LOC100114766 [Nasonia vitripennis]|uniref:Rho-GAP domain-containing protein n=1 Tax=Nasonia vitripennis TaxID=7425 RepID=A0A7M7G1Z7_NASVI|nr:uncharacterized protein LOC100114766 [Nasonia vitripennis]